MNTYNLTEPEDVLSLHFLKFGGKSQPQRSYKKWFLQNKMSVSCITPHRRSTTVSFETYPLYSFVYSAARKGLLAVQQGTRRLILGEHYRASSGRYGGLQ